MKNITNQGFEFQNQCFKRDLTSIAHNIATISTICSFRGEMAHEATDLVLKVCNNENIPVNMVSELVAGLNHLVNQLAVRHDDIRAFMAAFANPECVPPRVLLQIMQSEELRGKTSLYEDLFPLLPLPIQQELQAE